MVRSLTSGVSGMQQFQEQMDVIGNNIANVNTTAFKSSRVEFADAFSQTLQAPSGGVGGASNTPAVQVGTGVKTSGIRTLYTQGAVARTNVPTDVVIAGSGFFVVRDAVSNAEFATRAGNFRLDDQGRLVTNAGLRVRGFSDSALTTVGDITIDKTGAPAGTPASASVVSFSIDRQGKINVRLSEGTEFVRGQILLQDFRDPQALLKEANNLYSGLQGAGPLAAMGQPSVNGLGRLESGALELSNVDLANEFAGMITTQRAFQASARVITTSDEILQELVNLKR